MKEPKVLPMGLDQANPGANGVPPAPPVTAATATDVSGEGFPEIGTEAWGQMNKRRAELIRKKNRGGLDPVEMSEYEELQRLSRAALERAFPAPMKGEEELERLKAQLNNTSDANEK